MHLRAAKDAEEVAAVRRACAHIEAAYEELWADIEVGDERGGRQRARGLSAWPAAARRPPEPHILFGAHAARTARQARRAHAAARRRRSSPTSPRSSAATGATSRAARTPGRRATGPAAPGRSCTRPTTTRSRRRASAPRRATSTPPSGRSSRRTRRSAPACTAPATRSAPRSTSRRSWSRRSDAPLREGMIFTVEPGIYDSERGGIRLEDDVLVGPDGPVMLSPRSARATGALRPRRACARTSGASSRGCRRSPSSTSGGGRCVSRNTQPQSRPGAAVQARHPGGVGEQGDGVGGDREAHAARLVVATSRARSRRPRARISVPAATACA